MYNHILRRTCMVTVAIQAGRRGRAVVTPKRLKDERPTVAIATRSHLTRHPCLGETSYALKTRAAVAQVPHRRTELRVETGRLPSRMAIACPRQRRSRQHRLGSS